MSDTKLENFVLKNQDAVGCYPTDDIRRYYLGSHEEDIRKDSIFLSLRRRSRMKTEFAGRSVVKKFEEIVLTPDGIVAVLSDDVRYRRIE